MLPIYFLACVQMVAGRVIHTTSGPSPDKEKSIDQEYTATQDPLEDSGHTHKDFLFGHEHAKRSQSQVVVKRVDYLSITDTPAHRINGDIPLDTREFEFSREMSTKDLYSSETPLTNVLSILPVFETSLPHRTKTLTLTRTKTAPTTTRPISSASKVPTTVITYHSSSLTTKSKATSVIASETTLETSLRTTPKITSPPTALPKTAASTMAPDLESDSDTASDSLTGGEISGIVFGVISIFIVACIFTLSCNQFVARYKKPNRPKPLNVNLKGFPYPQPRLEQSYSILPMPQESVSKTMPQANSHTKASGQRSAGEQHHHRVSYTQATGQYPATTRYEVTRHDESCVTNDETLVFDTIEPQKNNGLHRSMSGYSSSVYSQDENVRNGKPGWI